MPVKSQVNIYQYIKIPNNDKPWNEFAMRAERV